MKNVRVDFSRPTFRDNAQTFDAFLERATRLPALRRLYDLNNEISLLMKDLRHPSDDLWLGQIHRIRNRGFPDRINLTTLHEEELGLLAEQALVDRVAFAYRTDLQALALQRIRDLRTTTFGTYVEYVAGMPFELPIILRGGAYQRLLRLRTISTMNIRVANPPDAAEFTGLDAPGVAEITGLLRDFGAARVEIRVRREKLRMASLIFDSVRDFVDSFVNNPQIMDSVETLTVEGKREDDEKLEPIDFVRDRLVYEDKVDYDRLRRLDSHQCERVVTRALAEHEHELRRR